MRVRTGPSRGKEPPEIAASVARAAAGDADAFGQLYDRYHPEIVRYFYARVHDSELARDLTQHLFLNAWQAIPRYQDRGLPFAAWLYRMAHNLAIDHFRRQRPVAAMPDFDVPAPEVEVAARLVARDRSAEVHAALDRLSPDHQRVLILRFVLEKSAREIGEIMGRKEVTVRGLQHRALRALRAELEARGDLS